MRVQTGIACLAAGALALLGGVAQAQHREGLSYVDRRFMIKAARGGIAEVRLGELASRRGSTDAVRDFGQRMVTDHSKANDDLKQVAANRGFTLPTDMDASSRALWRRLSRLNGMAFDRAYLRAMRDDHAKDVTEFRTEANRGHDPDVRDFASRTLPVIRDHYQMVTAMVTSPGRMRAHRSYENR